MTEQLLEQQLESPSGTGRVEPRSQIRLAEPANNQRDASTSTTILTGRSGATLRLDDLG